VQLRQALAAGDAVAISRMAHSLRGASGQLGGQRMASSCRWLEANAETGRLVDVQTDLIEVERDYQDLQGILSRRITASRSPAA
jgi:HPt (histidine-containing phosphotransfer) domain-containing protein